MDKILTWVGAVSTTNVRILATILFAGATTARYLLSTCQATSATTCVHWEPSLEWCGFLIGMSGLDTAHYFVKRKTSWNPADADVPDPTPDSPTVIPPAVVDTNEGSLSNK